MTKPLRVGVIGLGPLWRRQYAPALRGLRDRFEVAAVCDQVQERAVRVGKRCQCEAAGGPTDLLNRPGLEAVLLLDAQWHGWWAASRACAAGKAVFCCPFAGLTSADGEALVREARASGVAVVLALPMRVLPAAARLRELLAESLGPARVVLGSTGTAGGPTSLALLDLLDACASLLGAEPAHVTRADTAALSVLVLDYGAGRAAQLTIPLQAGPAGPARLEVIAQRGRVEFQLPQRLSWSGPTGRHMHWTGTHRFPAQLLLEQFHAAVRGEGTAAGLAEVGPLLGLLAATQLSAPAGT
jgi:predicted dehydrogenase